MEVRLTKQLTQHLRVEHIGEALSIVQIEAVPEHARTHSGEAKWVKKLHAIKTQGGRNSSAFLTPAAEIQNHNLLHSFRFVLVFEKKKKKTFSHKPLTTPHGSRNKRHIRHNLNHKCS